jgi:hypothetical protein
MDPSTGVCFERLVETLNEARALLHDTEAMSTGFKVCCAVTVYHRFHRHLLVDACTCHRDILF